MQFNNINFTRNSSPLVEYVENNIVNGTYRRVVEMVTKDGFVRDHFLKSDAKEQENVKALAAITIANHGREIADEIKSGNKLDEVRKVPSNILIDVMKMTIQAGTTPQNMAAFIDIMRDSGKLEEIMSF